MSKRQIVSSSEDGCAKKKKYSTSFKAEYSVEFPCIVKGKDASFAMCKMCHSEFSVMYGGRDDVKRHVNSKKHLINAKASTSGKPITSFFSSNSKSTPVDEAVIRAETLFTSFLLEHNIPLASSDHASKLFKAMFLVDSVQPEEIIKRYSCARTKTTAIVKELAMDARQSLIEKCKTSPFNIATDGSNDKTDKLYPLIVVSADESVKYELLSLLELKDKSTGANIAKLILDELCRLGIPFSNCMSLCTDNARSMIGEGKGLYGVLLKENAGLFATGCPCHRLHLAAEWASKELSFNPEPFFLDIYYYVEKSANRFQTFQECQNSCGTAETNIPKHVPTRWLSLGKITKWVLDQWEPLRKFFKDECDSDKKEGSKTSDRKRNALANLDSRVTKLTLHFLNFMLPLFDKTNCQLQAETPLIHRQRRILCRFIKDLMVLIVKPCAMLYKCVTDVDLDQDYNLKDPMNISLGEAATSFIQESKLSDDKVKKFRVCARNFVKVAIKYCLANLKLTDPILLNAEIADVSVRTTMSFKSVQYFLQRFPQILPSGASMDDLEREFLQYQVDDLLPKILEMDRADYQWQEISTLKDEIGDLRFKFLPKVMLTILSIPHGNASCERLFSTVRKNRTDFRGSLKTETLGDIILAKQSGTECYNRTLSSALLKKCKSATCNALSGQGCSAAK